jgi:hypothetical protein
MGAFADMLQEHMAKGYSFNTFYSTIKMPKEVVRGWLESQPEFKHAKELGDGIRKKYLEQLLLGKIITSDIYKLLLSEDADTAEESVDSFTDGVLIQAKERFQC